MDVCDASVNETQTTTYRSSWDFRFSELLNGILAGRKQLNKTVLDYANDYEEAIQRIDPDTSHITVRIYDQSDGVYTVVENPDSLYDTLIDDVEIENVELRHEQNGREIQFSYEKSRYKPFTVETSSHEFKDVIEEELGRSLHEEKEGNGLIGLFHP